MSLWLLPDLEDDSELLQVHFFPRHEAWIAAVTSLISTKSLLHQSKDKLGLWKVTCDSGWKKQMLALWKVVIVRGFKTRAGFG